MVTQCEKIGKYLLPIFRSLVAKELVNTYNLTQTEAAQRLGTTQAAISQYVNSKRAFKSTEQFAGILPKIQVKARETARRLANKEMSAEEVGADFCNLCAVFSEVEIDQTGDDYVI